MTNAGYATQHLKLFNIFLLDVKYFLGQNIQNDIMQ